MSAAADAPVAVTGATGFVGTNLVRSLLSDGVPVRAVVRSGPPGERRRRAKVERLRAAGCEIATADVRDPGALAHACAGCAAVIHLVAILRERPGATYERINRQGTAHVAAAAARAGVGRLIHLSALGAGPQATRYLRSKWAGEEEVRRAGVPYVIFRPSFLIGPGGGAAAQFADVVRLGPWYPFKLLVGADRLFAALAGLTPLVPVLGPGTARFAPLHLADLLAAVRQTLERDDLLGQTIELGGPQALTYDQMLQVVARVLGVRRRPVHIPLPAARVLVRLFAVLPNPPITQDELEALLVDNVCDSGPAARAFGLTLRPFDQALRDALFPSAPPP